MRYLGLDVGERRIGVALSDPGGVVAIPVTTIIRDRRGSVMKTILDLAAEREAEHIVVGLPISLSGQLGPQGELVMEFVQSLSIETSLPVSVWDERLSTVAADKMLLEAQLSPKRRRELRDAVAAAFMLQGYLDSRDYLDEDEDDEEENEIT
ncbi:MAG: ruvX [Dehalococcoidia bacterium]|nr:ruvX [Dehalococcoidia bacterium]